MTTSVTLAGDDGSMHIQTDRAFVPAGAPAVRYLHITISAPARKEGDTSRPPASISLVLDRSGSMGGQKIVMAREAVAYSTRLLNPTDHLAIVCYDNEITTVLDRTLATKEAKTLALARLAEIDARGNTNLHGGWMRGAELVDKADAVAKVMLLTDGLANEGKTDLGQLVETARQLRQSGILTSTFGVGRDFDENLLSRIATEGGGHFYFIETPTQIPDFLASELGETLEVVAHDAVLDIACDPGIEAVVLNELPADRMTDRVRIRIGNLVADQELTLIVAVAFKGAQAEATSLGVECRLSDRDGVLPSLPMPVKWDAVDAAQNAKQPVNADVMLAVATILAERARRAALAANGAGNFDEAKKIIAEVINDLRALASDDPRVRRVIDQLQHDALEFAGMMKPMLRKAKHFAAYQMLHSREEGGTARRRK